MQRVANASLYPDSTKLRDTFETCYVEIQNVALDPPDELRETLRDRRVTLDELTACFEDEACGMVASRTPAMSMNTRIEMLGDWVFHHAEALAEACNEALVQLRLIMDSAP